MYNLQRILPIDIGFKIKNIYKILLQKKCDKQIKSKNIYFLDSPSYGNIGDQAIALAMRKFMNDLLPQYNQVEFLENEFLFYIRWLKKNVKESDIICLNGGGNMGVMYPKYEAIRRIIIKSFPNNKIIIFPQTLDYEKSKYGDKEKKRASSIYSKHKHLLIMAREGKTYNEMKKIYPINTIVLCPDIVLYLNYMDMNVKKNDIIGICLRNDNERIINDEDIFLINRPIKKIATQDNALLNINNLNREKVVYDKLEEIASCKMIITDRLHGMIFAYITNTPCIALPNSNGKVEGVYNWIKGKGSTTFQKKYDDKDIKEKENELLTGEFNKLSNNILNFINGGVKYGKD